MMHSRAGKKPIPPDPTTPTGWLTVHRAHGGRPYYEVKIGEWHIWRCTCGIKFHFTEAHRNLEPSKYTIG